MGPVSAEEAWIRTCLGHSLFPGRPSPAAPRDLDWEQVYALACEHRLAGLLYTLGRSQPGLWPSALQEKLRSARYRTLLHGEWCNRQVQAVLNELDEADIPAIVLKGWARIPTVYEDDPGQRTYEDIDLVVRPEQVAEAEEALARVGYRSSALEPWPGYRWRYGTSWRYRNQLAYEPDQDRFHPASFFSVGLHTGLLHQTVYDRRMPVQQFFQRAQPLQVAGANAHRLAAEDDLVYSCAHLAVQHAYDGALFRYYEIAALILRAGPALDWEAVVERAGAWRLVLSVQGVLRLVEGLWPGVVPPEKWVQISALQASRAERWFHGLQSGHHGNSTLRVLLDWLMMPGATRRTRYLLETAFPGPIFLQGRYGSAPAGLWPVLYVHHAATAAKRLLR
jgi:hypothetical protein